MNLDHVERRLDDEMNMEFANEKSVTLKMCMLKHKCILMFSFMLVSILQFLYIILTKVLDDQQMKDAMLQLISMSHRNLNTTV
jgi:hypothetical protein